ncbi:glycosyltransferase family 4 protein [Candidatus Parcubacteria bacterium]|nr:glycosyltransferase family 4 protein [Candidatus Parcubacteria bacterium]
MKIFYIANVRMPTEKAHGGQIMKMCEAWANVHQVILWSPWRVNYIKKDPFDFYCVEKKFKIKKIFSLDFLPVQRLFGRSAFYFQNISFAFFVFLRLLFVRADLFFSRDFWSSFFLSLFGKKVVYEIHDSPSQHLITKFAFRYIYKFVTTNKFKARELQEKFDISKDKILVAPNGVDIGLFNISVSKEECRKKMNLPLDKKIILYTGHLYSWKGADIFLKAAINLKDDDIVSVFVGGTPEDFERFKNNAKNTNNILILGHQEQSSIPYFLKASDILILPNTAKERISREETSPLKLFEYMVSEKPIIASNIPSIREIVDEKEVVFFEPDNAEDLKNKIIFVLNNYENCLKLAKNAKEKIAVYSWDKRTEKILEFVEN